jgi:serine-type D-Ala-D-Ala carboxypeptidase (penicillin-binding protein 5/6)
MKRKQRQKKHHIFIVILILLIEIGIFGRKSYHLLAEKFLIVNREHSSDTAPSLSYVSGANQILSEHLYSTSAILVRLNDHTVLMQKNSDDKIYPASLTKMMTAIIAIEDLPNLQKKVNLSASIFKELDNTDASTAGFLPNEQISVIDLLYGTLLPSGAECCIGLADRAAGSERNFVEQMNKKAKALGMSQTHFENVTGLQNENHYTTVKDLAILLSYAIQNKTFKEIFTTSRHSVQPTNMHPNGITFSSTLFESLTDPHVSGGKITGGKTGYTEEAGLCLASLASINGQEYILITAGAKGDHKTEQYDITDALKVYNSLSK